MFVFAARSIWAQIDFWGDIAMGTEGQGQRIGVVVIHGVGDTQTGWINERIVEPMAGQHPDLMLGSYSEVYPFYEESAGEKNRYNALIRRAEIDGTKIAVAELLWADLSRIGNSAISKAAATLKLGFEAPDVLALALMRGRERGVFRLIKALVLTSSRLLLWLIVGLNICVLAGTAWMMGVIKFHDSFDIPRKTFDNTDVILWLGPLIVFLCVVGAVLFFTYRHREMGLSEFGRGLLLSTLLITGFLVVDHIWPAELLEGMKWLTQQWRQDAYIDNGRLVVFGVWVLWSISTLLVFVLLLSVWLKRRIWISPSAVPLAPGWVALFHILVQAVIVKLIFAPLSMASCSQMRALVGDKPQYEALGICSAVEMSGVFFMALVETVVIVFAVLLVWRARARASRRPELDSAVVPRLIVNRWIITAAAISVTAHIAIFFVEMRGGDAYKTLLPGQLMFGLTLVLPVYLYLLSYFYRSSTGLVHIARDLVDHQYRVVPAKKPAPAPAGGVPATGWRWLNWTSRLNLTEYPRRYRIAARLDRIMSSCFAPEGLDRLVIVAHSQGTVIAFDYLRASGHSELLSKAREVRVVTLGSPLSHLYAEYFEEYRRPLAREELCGNVTGWVNMWRIDDPIGNKVEVVTDGFIKNVVLPRGGHVNYWKEPEVQQAIAAAIAGR